MPEGPEVRRICDKLRLRLKGKLLLWVNPSTLNTPDTKFRPYLETILPQIGHLFPTSCLDIVCRGKQLFFFFENGMAFTSSLGLEGHWYYFDSFVAAQRYKDTHSHGHVCMNFGRRVEDSGTKRIIHISEIQLWYDDSRHFGNFTITDWKGAIEKMKEFGPDLLATSVPLTDIHPIVQRLLPIEFTTYATLPAFIASIRSSRRKHFPLCQFLMKPEYFSGIGNYLKSEVLYRARLHPNRTLETLTDQEITNLFSICLTTILQAYQHGGLTHGTFLDPDMQKGTFPVQVYKRDGQLDSNGLQIVRIDTYDQGKSSKPRGSYIVPQLQLC